MVTTTSRDRHLGVRGPTVATLSPTPKPTKSVLPVATSRDLQFPYYTDSVAVSCDTGVDEVQCTDTGVSEVQCTNKAVEVSCTDSGGAVDR